MLKYYLFFKEEVGIRVAQESRGLEYVYKRQACELDKGRGERFKDEL